MTGREIVELAQTCGRRICTSEYHWNCPFGNESMIDCVVRPEAAYDAAVEQALQDSEELHRFKPEAEKYIPHCCTCCQHQGAHGRCALLPDGDEFSADNTEGFDRDDCEHWALRLPKK